MFDLIALLGLEAADLYNGLMQCVFIVTGLVSIKSLTEMITQLVGQGDALKDGADTSKEVAKRLGQTAAVGVAGAGLAIKGAKLGKAVAGSVGGTLANSKTGKAISAKAHGAAGALKDKAGNWSDDHISPHVNSAKDKLNKTSLGKKIQGYKADRADKKLERDMFSAYRENGFTNGAVLGFTGDQLARFEKFNKHQDTKDKVVAAGGAVKGGAQAVYHGGQNVMQGLRDDQIFGNSDKDGNYKRFGTHYKDKNGNITEMKWNDFASAGQDFNKLWGGVTGFTGWYKQMESDDAVIGGDDGHIHKLMGALFKFKNDKEKGKEQTDREAAAYAAQNIARAIEEYGHGHDYVMRDSEGNIIRDANGNAKTVRGVATMNVTANNVDMDNKGNMTTTGNANVDVKNMPELKLRSDTKLSLNDTQMQNIVRGMASLSRTEQNIASRLQSILDKLNGTGGGTPPPGYA